MTRTVKMVGLDCGSTTTSAVVASGRLTTSALGRMELTELTEIFRSEIVFTPFDDENQIDAARLERYLDDWLAASGTQPREIFGGGALVTGLAAQRKNAATVTQWIENRMDESVIATADDPCLESWLAFMGNCHALSKAHPRTMFLNLDLGGGTTNLALGTGGQVIATGCLFVGARHIQFVPGTYEITNLSPCAVALLEHLGIQRPLGATLQAAEIESILDFYLELIEAAIQGDSRPFATAIGRWHLQVPLERPELARQDLAVTLSGGVGQLVYQHMHGDLPDGITPYGDLGSALALRILRTPSIVGRMDQFLPEGLGRATVYGLLRHSTELSGSTIYLPNRQRLPLKNVPIVGRLDADATAEQVAQVLGLAARGTPAACVQIDLEPPTLSAVRSLGNRLAQALESRSFWPDRVLVLLVPVNLGKVLGNYATRWGTLNVDVIVVDEVPQRDAQFVRLGRSREGVVPVWLYAVR
jgi:ethanolamine utilization protein EutA